MERKSGTEPVRPTRDLTVAVSNLIPSPGAWVGIQVARRSLAAGHGAIQAFARLAVRRTSRQGVVDASSIR